MAHTKSGGSTKLGRDSAAKRLGVKISDGQPVKIGQIIIRQRGTKYRPGRGVGRGEDDTLFATANGKVSFYRKTLTSFDGSPHKTTFVTVLVPVP